MIRDAFASDVPRLVELLRQLSLGGEVREGDPHDSCYVAAFAAMERDPRSRILVVEENERVVGMAQLSILPNMSHMGRPVAHVENVVVDEMLRGQHLGERLLRRAIEIARAAGCFRMELTSRKERHAAQRFYERVGFVPSHVGFKLTL